MIKYIEKLGKKDKILINQSKLIIFLFMILVEGNKNIKKSFKRKLNREVEYKSKYFL